MFLNVGQSVDVLTGKDFNAVVKQVSALLTSQEDTITHITTQNEKTPLLKIWTSGIWSREAGRSRFLHSIETHLQNYTTSHSRRTQS
jgi:hypothetical protein